VQTGLEAVEDDLQPEGELLAQQVHRVVAAEGLDPGAQPGVGHREFDDPGAREPERLQGGQVTRFLDQTTSPGSTSAVATICSACWAPSMMST
jgi:hypothetical protein